MTHTLPRTSTVPQFHSAQGNNMPVGSQIAPSPRQPDNQQSKYPGFPTDLFVVEELKKRIKKAYTLFLEENEAIPEFADFSQRNWSTIYQKMQREQNGQSSSDLPPTGSATHPSPPLPQLQYEAPLPAAERTSVTVVSDNTHSLAPFIPTGGNVAELKQAYLEYPLLATF